MALARVIRRVGVTLGIIAVEDAFEPTDGHPRALVGDDEVGEAVVTVSCTRISLPGGANETALSIKFSARLSIISSVPSTKTPGTSSADIVRS
jgi:hypothetical protein